MGETHTHSQGLVQLQFMGLIHEPHQPSCSSVFYLVQLLTSFFIYLFLFVIFTILLLSSPSLPFIFIFIFHSFSLALSSSPTTFFLYTCPVYVITMLKNVFIDFITFVLLISPSSF